MATIHGASAEALGANLSDHNDAVRFFREVLRDALQQLIEDGFTAFIGAAPHQRTDARTNQRNGHRPRVLSTPAGDLDQGIP